MQRHPDYKKLAILAVSKHGRALEHVSKALRGDKEVVLEAVKKNGFALEHASKELRKDRVVVLTAMNNIPYALKFADQSLLKDVNFICEVLKRTSKLTDYLVPNDLTNGKHYLIPRDTLALAKEKLKKEGFIPKEEKVSEETKNIEQTPVTHKHAIAKVIHKRIAKPYAKHENEEEMGLSR